MTLEEQRDYTALSYFFNNPKVSMSDIVTYLSNIVGNENAPKIYEKYVKEGYFNIEFINGSNQYTISEGGKIYTAYLKKEIDKEDIDIKLKKISISNIGFNKYFPSIAVGVAILSIIVPILLRQCDKDKIVTYKIQPEQWQLIIKSQEKNAKPTQEVHHGLGGDSLLSH